MLDLIIFAVFLVIATLWILHLYQVIKLERRDYESIIESKEIIIKSYRNTEDVNYLED